MKFVILLALSTCCLALPLSLSVNQEGATEPEIMTEFDISETAIEDVEPEINGKVLSNAPIKTSTVYMTKPVYVVPHGLFPAYFRPIIQNHNWTLAAAAAG